eukprot:Rhum_TRINITY_DN15412_c4_g1::Rhum_TRINITY_DN15412_c4_g1_i1::g.156486::m.156486
MGWCLLLLLVLSLVLLYNVTYFICFPPLQQNLVTHVARRAHRRRVRRPRRPPHTARAAPRAAQQRHAARRRRTRRPPRLHLVHRVAVRLLHDVAQLRRRRPRPQQPHQQRRGCRPRRLGRAEVRRRQRVDALPGDGHLVVGWRQRRDAHHDVAVGRRGDDRGRLVRVCVGHALARDGHRRRLLCGHAADVHGDGRLGLGRLHDADDCLIEPAVHALLLLREQLPTEGDGRTPDQRHEQHGQPRQRGVEGRLVAEEGVGEDHAVGHVRLRGRDAERRRDVGGLGRAERNGARPRRRDGHCRRRHRVDERPDVDEHCVVLRGDPRRRAVPVERHLDELRRVVGEVVRGQRDVELHRVLVAVRHADVRRQAGVRVVDGTLEAAHARGVRARTHGAELDAAGRVVRAAPPRLPAALLEHPRQVHLHLQRPGHRVAIAVAPAGDVLADVHVGAVHQPGRRDDVPVPGRLLQGTERRQHQFVPHRHADRLRHRGVVPDRRRKMHDHLSGQVDVLVRAGDGSQLEVHELQDLLLPHAVPPLEGLVLLHRRRVHPVVEELPQAHAEVDRQRAPRRPLRLHVGVAAPRVVAVAGRTRPVRRVDAARPVRRVHHVHRQHAPGRQPVVRRPVRPERAHAVQLARERLPAQAGRHAAGVRRVGRDTRGARQADALRTAGVHTDRTGRAQRRGPHDQGHVRRASARNRVDGTRRLVGGGVEGAERARRRGAVGLGALGVLAEQAPPQSRRPEGQGAVLREAD